MEQDTAPKPVQPLSPAYTAEDLTRPSTRYVDAVFLCLAIGAFIILGIQTLGAPTESEPETAVTPQPAGEIKLVSEVTPEPEADVAAEPVAVVVPKPKPESLPLSGEAADAHFGGRISLVSTAPLAFVIRADGTRFEPGSTLPGGAVLSTIKDSHLSLQADGDEIIITLP